MSKLKNLFTNITLLVFIVTVLLFFIIAVINPDFKLDRFENILSVMLRILGVTGITALISKFVRKSTLLKSVLLLVTTILIWFSFFPLYSIRFQVNPEDAAVFLNGAARLNPVRGLCPGSYDFEIRSPMYETTAMTLNFMDVLISRTVDVRMEPLKGMVRIETNVENPDVALRDTGSGQLKEFGKSRNLQAVQYGEYWCILEKTGYQADSVRIQVDSDSSLVRINLAPVAVPTYPVTVMTRSDASIFWLSQGRWKHVTDSNIYGAAEFRLPSGPQSLELEQDNDRVKRVISVQRDQNNYFELYF
ncbi:hypothetical protein JW948_13545 [bacterium]|nr:hypothetical protein [bacterium]